MKVRAGQALVALVGEGLKDATGISGEVFGVLREFRIEMVSQGSSEVALSFLVGEGDLPLIVRRLHTKFFAAKSQ